MTLAEIKTAVRNLLQDDEYDGDTIKQAANWFVYELANNNRLRMFEESTELTGSIDDTSVDFPEDSIAWISIYTTIPSVYDMSDNFMDYNSFMGSHAGFASASASRASNWTQFGNAMRFSHPLSVEHTFQIDYIREPEPMEGDNDECEIPDRYAELVARGTKARILEIEEEYEYASQERDILEPLQTTFVRNESRGGGKTKPTIIRTRRRPGNSSGVPRLGE